ncbi:MAG: hypothetical protein HRU17_15845 [Polyangiaceae bacterium]|nr:hypothetical protein [Polyangiaceae bacterium]
MGKQDTHEPEIESPPRALRLTDVLRVLPKSEIKHLTDRLKINIDPTKRIDTASQVARALVALPEARDPARLPMSTIELLHRICEARGVLEVEALPAAVEPLVARGMVFARGGDNGGVELLLPIAYLVQLRTWEGDDPRGLRALLSQVSPDVASSIATHYLGRPATPPISLSLEPAWEALNDPQRLDEEVARLAPLERKLLEAVEQLGGEVDTEELLDLEREPMRLRGAGGATPSRRGVGFALERRGFLVPIHPNRHIVPSEVGRVVGARQRNERNARRGEIRTFVLGEDHAPRRAQFAADPVPLALAMAILVRESANAVRADVGTPRSLVQKFATRLGRDVEDVALIAALSRAIGLWDTSAADAGTPPGSWTVGELGQRLFHAWNQGGAWDDARPEGEVLRGAREASAVGVLREMVVDALGELGEGRWVPWEALAGYVRTDSRTPGVGRLLQRWAQRSGVETMTPAEVAQRIALETLHRLGAVDLGDVGMDDDSDPEMSPTLRITARARAFLSDEALPAGAESRFLDNQALRIGADAKVGDVIALAPFIDLGGVTNHLDVVINQAGVARALGGGLSGDSIQRRIAAVAALSDPIQRMLTQASTVLGRAEFVASEGFLWVDDPELRELLRSRRQTSEMFVDPSPPGGLLVCAGVDIERIASRCRALGIEVYLDGEAYRTRSTAPPARRVSVAPDRRQSGTRRRKSAAAMPAAKRKSSTSLPAQKRASAASTTTQKRASSTTTQKRASSTSTAAQKAK